MMTRTIANHKLLPQPVDSPNFLPLLRLSAVVDSPDAHWRQLFVDPRFQAEKKISERITDGTLLTMCMKLSLCEIAAKSHLVFTRLSPCSVLTSRSVRFSICSARTSLAYPSSFCQAGTSQNNCRRLLTMHIPKKQKKKIRHRQIHIVLQISPLHSEPGQSIFFF